MDLIKRHKGLALVLSLTLVLVVLIFVIFAKMIFSNGDSIYGHRLDGLVKVSKKVTDDVVSSVTDVDFVTDVDVRIQGRIIYTTILFKQGTKLDKAKEVASNTLSKYSDDVIECYDFGYFLKEDVSIDGETDQNKKTGFIVTGTKHPSIDKISWIK